MIAEELIKRQVPLVTKGIKEAAEKARSHEDLRAGFIESLYDFQKALGIKLEVRHEYTVGTGRLDSIYQCVIIEYKDPSSHQARLTQQPDSPANQAVVGQLKQRFIDVKREHHQDYERLFGVGTDGRFFIFVKYRKGKWQIGNPMSTGQFAVDKFLRALLSLGLKKQSFTPEFLAQDFGADSDISRNAVRALYNALTKKPRERTLMFFNQWKILFGEVCGYDVDILSKKISELSEFYLIGETQPKPAELMFCVHTYYATFIKLLACEIVSSFNEFIPSTIRKLADTATPDELRQELENLILRGGMFKEFKITNFLEGDFFTWYLNEWNEKVSDSFHALVERLSQYDPRSLSVEPTESRDLLKHLYQQLFPKTVRHDLGEYYTPDWLAEHVLNEVGYDGNPKTRLLDPACGSGTFLVLALQRALDYYKEHREGLMLGDADLLKRFQSNIVGFDLNPLAVMTARTNYLLAVRSLIGTVGAFEIPVYLCDSVVTPAMYWDLFTKKVAKVPCSPLKPPHLPVPREIAVDHDTVRRYADVLERAVKDGYSPEVFVQTCKDRGIPIEHEELHHTLLATLQELAQNDKNGIWARIIKNNFAPLFEGEFDLVVGNPPWVNWESLPQDYRNSMKELWRDYGLFSLSGSEGRLGGGKKDISMLFVYNCADYYLRSAGKLGFVITQTVFKTKGAGDGFRRFKFNPRDPKKKEIVYLKVLSVDDMSSFQPFEQAANRTAVFVCEKSKKPFKYPVPYRVWRKKRKVSITSKIDSKVDYGETRRLMTFTAADDLKTVRSKVNIVKLAATPVMEGNPTSPWLTTPQDALPGLRKVIGESSYTAHAGVCTWLNGVYWVNVLKKVVDEDENELLLIENLHDVGKIEVEKVRMSIEPDLVYPLLRGRDVLRWQAKPSAYIILAQDPKAKKGWPVEYMQERYPATYSYLKRFEDKLRARSGYRKYYKSTDPFYSMYDVDTFTLSRWKVLWREQSTEFQATRVTPKDDLPVLPDHKLMMVACESLQEANYLTALLNSSPSRLLIQSYVISTSTSTHVLEHVSIPQFKSSDKLHKHLAELSEQAHQAAAEGDKKKVAEIEAEIDKAAAKLWGITDKELKAIQKALRQM